jgi:hypothetical protein
MSTALPPAELAKLQKIIAMIGSPCRPERDAAISGETRLLERNGLKGCQVAVIAQIHGVPPTPLRRQPSPTWQILCSRLQARVSNLCPWERDFITSLPRFPRLSARQSYIVREIAARVLGGGAP